jgi:type IV pilus assembly protein PilW
MCSSRCLLGRLALEGKRVMTYRTTRTAARASHGFSVIELLVALALGMALTVAITLVMMRQDSSRRSMTSSNDAQLNASYLAYLLDRSVRSAGTGYAHGSQSTYGCQLFVTRSGTTLLPRGGSFPAPFAGVGAQMRLAPVLVHAGVGAGGSDVLSITGGASGMGEAASRVLPGSITATSLNVPTTIGTRAGDLVLVAERDLGCMVQQLAPGFAGGATQALNFGGAYSAGTVAGFSLVGFSGAATVSNLGNPVGSSPQWQLIGLGNNSTLFSYDLLRLDGTDTPRPLAEGVVELRALYGVDQNADGMLDTWVSPTDPNYTAVALQDGTAGAQERLLRIMALRVGLILRSDRVEKEAVNASSLTLFQDLPGSLQTTRNLSADEQKTRHRVLELTIPLRNSIHQVR